MNPLMSYMVSQRKLRSKAGVRLTFNCTVPHKAGRGVPGNCVGPKFILSSSGWRSSRCPPSSTSLPVSSSPALFLCLLAEPDLCPDLQSVPQSPSSASPTVVSPHYDPLISTSNSTRYCKFYRGLPVVLWFRGRGLLELEDSPSHVWTCP